MADWLIAATAAGMPGMVEEKPKFGRAPYTEQRYVVDETAEYSTAWDLPSVDDLEVAAAAAAAALDIFAPPPRAVSSDEDSSDEDSDDDDEDGDSPMLGASAAAEHTTVRVKLLVPDSAAAATDGSSCAIKLQLSYHTSVPAPVLAAATLAGARRYADSSPLASSDESSSSSDEEEVTSKGGGPIMGLDEMRAMITKACEIVDEDEDGGGGGAEGVKLGGMKEALGLPEITPLDVEVGPNDAIQPAGIVMSVMDGMIVLMGSANAPVLSEGSVLVLGDRTPVGRVEEVFGPVATPFYALRYAGAAGSAIPASIAPGSPMFSVLKFSTFISPDELVTSSTAAPARPIKVAGEHSDPESDDEVYFSDDEKEAEYQQKQHSTKRRAGEAPLGRGGEGAAAAAGGGGGRGRGGRSGERRGLEGCVPRGVAPTWLGVRNRLSTACRSGGVHRVSVAELQRRRRRPRTHGLCERARLVYTTGAPGSQGRGGSSDRGRGGRGRGGAWGRICCGSRKCSRRPAQPRALRPSLLRHPRPPQAPRRGQHHDTVLRLQLQPTPSPPPPPLRPLPGCLSPPAPPLLLLLAPTAAPAPLRPRRPLRPRQPPPHHPSQQPPPHHSQPPQYQQHPHQHHPPQFPGYPAGPPGPWGPHYAQPYMYQPGPPPQGYPGHHPSHMPPPHYGQPYQQHPAAGMAQYPPGQGPPTQYSPYGNAAPAGYPAQQQQQQQWPAPGPGGR
ncbi:MAG: hypothetical protein WDW38_005121 [Sanguina aurantia]